MPRRIRVGNQTYVVPDDATDDEITQLVDGQSTAPQAPQSQPTTMQKIGSTLGDVGIGAIKGLGNTTSGVSDLIHSIPYVGPKIIPSEGVAAFHEINKPTNTAQKVGYYGEQIGEYLLPTGVESGAAKLASKSPVLAKAAVPLAKVGASAIEAGIHNKLQGGDFESGAKAGAIGSGIGQGMRAVAPKIVESALGITKSDRGYGKTIGDAVLKDTKGIRPATIAENAENKAGELTKGMGGIEEMAAQHYPSTVSTKGAVDSIDSRMGVARAQNDATTHGALGKVKDAITKDFETGAPIPVDVPASKALDLKRGLRSQFVKNWNPDLNPAVTRDAAKEASHAIDSTLDANLGPSFASKNQRISSLLGAADAAESTSRNSGIAQKALHRFGAHTGALAGGIAGGYGGYHSGGVPGMLAGGAAGILVPEIIASPTLQMGVARTLNSPNTAQIGKGISLQLARQSDDEENKKH